MKKSAGRAGLLAIGLTGISLLPLGACEEDAEVRAALHRNRGVPRAKIAPSEKRSPRAPRRERRDLFAPPEGRPPANSPAAEAAAPPPAAPPERDLPDELRALIGNPTSCLTGHVADGTPSLQLSITAYVTSSGIITRAEAAAAPLDADGRRCVEEQIEGRRMRGPIPDAPRAIRTSVALALAQAP